jgi:hypothetical protein
LGLSRAVPPDLAARVDAVQLLYVLIVSLSMNWQRGGHPVGYPINPVVIHHAEESGATERKGVFR